MGRRGRFHLLLRLWLRRRPNTDFGFQRQLFAVTQDDNVDLVARPCARHLVHRVAGVVGLLAVDAEEQVAREQAGTLRRAIAMNPSHHDSGTAGLAKELGQFLGQRLHRYTKPAANDLSLFDDRLDHIHGELHRYRETDALGTAGFGDDRRVDANQMACCIHQRTTRITAVDRGVSLDEVFIGIEPKLVASGGTDDAHGHRLPYAERVANRQGHIAYTNAVR